MSQTYGWLTLEEIRQGAVNERMKALENNKSRVAESLGITRQTVDTIIKAYEERSAEDKERIRRNNEKLKEMTNQNAKTFVHDPITGQSNPVPPPPLPKIELFKPRTDTTDPLSKSLDAENQKKRPENNFRPNLIQPVKPPMPAPLMIEAQKERERFEKLDKRTLSEKYFIKKKDTDDKMNVMVGPETPSITKEEVKGNGHDKAKAKKKVKAS